MYRILPVAHPKSRGSCGSHKVLPIGTPLQMSCVRCIHRCYKLQRLHVPDFYLALKVAETTKKKQCTRHVKAATVYTDYEILSNYSPKRILFPKGL